MFFTLDVKIGMVCLAIYNAKLPNNHLRNFCSNLVDFESGHLDVRFVIVYRLLTTNRWQKVVLFLC